MNFDLGPDELALRDAIREVCERSFPVASLRERGVDPELWSSLGRAGVFAMRVPADQGGLGLGATQAVVVFQELGRALIPGPVIATYLAARSNPAAATGHTVAGLADATAAPIVIEHLEVLDDLLVIDDDGVYLVDVSKLDARPIGDPIDPLTPAWVAGELPPLVRLGKAEHAAAWRAEATALTAAMLAGIASRVTELAVAYAKDRHQFDRPIASFQAVKHLCADMLVRAEVARAAVDAAGAMLDDPAAGDARRAAAAAKVVAGEAAYRNAKSAIQVYGGMGFTWEVDLHLYLKRAIVLGASFGTAGAHAKTLAGAR